MIMKNIKILFLPAVLMALWVTGCKKFDEINVDPYLANESQVQVEYFINGAMMADQMDPHISERIFVLYWKSAGHQQWGGGITTGGYDDGWSSDWYGTGYHGRALNRIYSAVQVAEKQIADGNIKEYTNNLLQIARIYRVYLLSELADNFGPISLNGFQAVNPDFSNLKTVYYFMLDELKDASTKLDIAETVKPNPDLDQAYGYDYSKWQKYANSMRLRLAMRLSEVDEQKARTEFEDAASKPLITGLDESFQIAEKDGWDDLTGVMTREWNHFQMPQTLNNLYTNLGGVKTADQDANLAPYVKPANYVGLRFLDHWPTKTNDPIAGYWLDGMPNAIDPRAYKTFIPPGYTSNPQFNRYGGDPAITTVRRLNDAAGNAVKTIDAKFHWNGIVNGNWGDKGPKNTVGTFIGTTPRLANKYRDSKNKRLFYGPWESYFLLAEGAVRGWTTPVTGKVAYETGIERSFAYFGVSEFVASYLGSESYNHAGTSVKWEHTTEPGTSHTMQYVDGYTGAAGTVEILYPVNNLYKNGTVKNDQLTKIITQKFIAQTPWLPLETWSDHRRLGLPFFENPAVEKPMTNLPDLNESNYMTSSVKFFPQRLRYPSNLAASNPKGYQEALGFLGGEGNDRVLTPLWWARQ